MSKYSNFEYLDRSFEFVLWDRRRHKIWIFIHIHSTNIICCTDIIHESVVAWLLDAAP
jgi:hypothetical protein